MRCAVFLLAGLLFSPVVGATDLSELELVLHGTGEIRYLGFIKVYDAALYAPASASRVDIQQARTSYCLVLDYHVDLSADDFIKAANKVLARQHSPERLRSMLPQTQTLHSRYQAVSEGDRYSFCYDIRSASSSLLLNEQRLVTVPGADFAEFYGGIWLGNKAPIDSGLRDDLLTPSSRERQKK